MNTSRLSSSRKHEFDVARTGPGTLAGQYLRRFWQPVRLSSMLRNGKAMPIRLMSEDYTLYRGESGTPHLLDPTCPHRGTRLSTGRVEGDCLSCMYHGWKFDGDGQCVEQPNEHTGFAHKVKIGGYPAVDYLGLIFVYVGPRPAPPLPRIKQLEGAGILDQTYYIRDCNYFQNLENMLDETHTVFTHRVSVFSDPGSINRDVPRIEAEEAEYGLIQHAIRSDNSVRDSHYLMPNSLIMQLPFSTAFEDETAPTGRRWTDYIAWRVPIDDDVHLSCAVQRLDLDGEDAERYFQRKREVQERLSKLIPTREVSAMILSGEVDIDDLSDREDLVNIQDNVTQMGQGPIADRENERLGPADTAVILLRKIWRRELEALAKGGSPTAWRIPDKLSTTSGLES